MRKLLLIGFKDVLLAFRDRAGLILMLLAPFVLTLGLGAVTGRFSGNTGSGISHIQVVLVNQDGGQLGNALVELFQSAELDELVDPVVYNDISVAYKQVDDNRIAAAVIIPTGFTASIIPAAGQTAPSQPVQIELYSNPIAPNSAGVVKTIVEEFLSQVEVGKVGGEVTVTQLIRTGRIQPQQAADIGLSAGMGSASEAGQNSAITLKNVTPSGTAVKFDMLALLAPSMALMFLMYTVTFGGRTFLTEKNQGTLPRLLVTPTTATQVLAGKMIGIFVTGFLQMYILVEGTGLIFNLEWGNPIALYALILAAVFAAVSWGMLLSAVARTPGQVSAIGSALMLTFGILGGGFINAASMPQWFQVVMKVSPNAWGMDGFTTLALGGGLKDISTPILALVVMGVLLFSISVVLMKRRSLAEK